MSSLHLRVVFGSFWCLAFGGYAVQTNYTGYIIDGYCYGLQKSGSPTSLDGSDIFREPNKHSLHCLRDVPQCRGPYYLAINRPSGGENNYGIKFLLDEASEQHALALIDSFPRGHNRSRGVPFRIRAFGGSHSGDGILHDAAFEVCDDEDGCDGVCTTEPGGDCDSPTDLEMELRPSWLIVLHVCCMCLSWGFLLPLGVVWARNARAREEKLCGHPVWFAGHRALQSAGWFLQLVGFWAIYNYKIVRHFRVRHEILGLTVVFLGTMQPFNALVRKLKCVGHFRADGSKTVPRFIWELVHKGAGYTAVTLGGLNVVFGVFHARRFGFSGLSTLAGVFAAVILGPIFAVGAVLEVQRCIKSRQTDAARSISSDGADRVEPAAELTTNVG